MARWLDKVKPRSPVIQEEVKPDNAETANNPTDKNLPAIVFTNAPSGEVIPSLPWQLAGLLRAAGSKQLTISLKGVPDVCLYTLAWGVAYLVGDRDEALARLWQVYMAWQEGKQHGSPN
jgi:hypothetical protein